MLAELKYVLRFEMNLIDQEAHVWELYQDCDHYYLSLEVKFSAGTSCWDLVLNQEEVQSYEHRGRASIRSLANELLDTAHRGDFSAIESRLAKPYERYAMQRALKKAKEVQAQTMS